MRSRNTGLDSMKDALSAFVDHLERCQLRLHGTVPPVAAREIAKMRVILADADAGDMPEIKKPALSCELKRVSI